MANTYKVLGQLNPAATTLSTLYTVPSGNSAVISTMSICNQGNTTTYRVAISPNGAAIDPKHYIVYDTYVNSNDTVFLTLGLSMGAADLIRVYAGTANLSFNVFGSELY